ncbi:hypothetical protein COE43_13055, partial [Bacillus cereus]
MDNKFDLIIQYLKAYNMLEIFSGISTDNFQVNHFEKGKLICDKDDEINRLYFVVKGKVKVYTITP